MKQIQQYAKFMFVLAALILFSACSHNPTGPTDPPPTDVLVSIPAPSANPSQPPFLSYERRSGIPPSDPNGQPELFHLRWGDLDGGTTGDAVCNQLHTDWSPTSTKTTLVCLAAFDGSADQLSKLPCQRDLYATALDGWFNTGGSSGYQGAKIYVFGKLLTRMGNISGFVNQLPHFQLKCSDGLPRLDENGNPY